MTLTIRDYRPADLETVASLWMASWDSTGVMAPDTSGTAADLRKRLPEEIAEGWSVYVAEAHGAIVGFCALTDDKLKQLFVAPSHQGAGIGKRLLDFVKQIRPEGFSLTTPCASRACRFYAREGMICDDASPHPRFGFPRFLYSWTPK